ncbi:bifunctional UDP-N-acetylglucosamine diphosphorylase/glucosamine-1-phosphate N-acetyltransferase GlmU [Kushneria phosphatilytica]|uniref:Bifunctional protein GlmU n=1 Tax=Kushneria phosphatilytica TaxID=657387 RepID=A0A1S1NTX2_9GAMM|nr:bifunctional UDP-N-acetylglucosamine diphosphorylase/glucosamine-1-phosphate N-acetyltransferase GlmU [Kushneria phosphatilytica]OHV08879.1 UDP-N-acetylglucosamine diphosphorylase/glucosamine-1-phosphate N-acetyltransferase [Kushneria phosphatilytica]QEL12600.1 UDP-N-acetylglucosamine diphosphorylase/glucosamine-1-phosphate N-acetyltransferase [Kushneria phosphatilytica]
MSTDVVILAAGQGSRMRSRLPKVLHPIAGKPMVRHVIEAAESLEEARLHVVVGHGADRVRESLSDVSANFVMQEEQRGTGDAVARTLDALGDGPVLVLYGDVPLIQPDTLAALMEGVDAHHMALLTVRMAHPHGYGRIVRDEQGRATAIVEEKDASEAQKRIQECNTGILAATGAHLKRWLPQLSSDNAQGEYYLTDIIAMAAAEEVEVLTREPHGHYEVQGVNDRVQLSALERIHQHHQAQRLMREGATLADPGRIEVRGELSVGRDVFIDVGCVFEGTVSLADGVVVGAYSVIRDAHIGEDTTIEAHTLIEGAEIAGAGQIGPFARLRPGTRLARGARIGNFVETKNARIGEGSKINHLSYIGDSELGRDVNIGAGTITCNYDGVSKHRTEIGDGVFVGSNSALVAPLRIGRGATIAAGSTITDTVDDDSLAIGRSRQTQKSDWVPPHRR